MREHEEDQPKSETRKTVDLCGQQGETSRCMRERGHTGKHQCLSWQTAEWVDWE